MNKVIKKLIKLEHRKLQITKVLRESLEKNKININNIWKLIGDVSFKDNISKLTLGFISKSKVLLK